VAGPRFASQRVMRSRRLADAGGPPASANILVGMGCQGKGSLGNWVQPPIFVPPAFRGWANPELHQAIEDRSKPFGNAEGGDRAGPARTAPLPINSELVGFALGRSLA
jgi:hypothetical protein